MAAEISLRTTPRGVKQKAGGGHLRSGASDLVKLGKKQESAEILRDCSAGADPGELAARGGTGVGGGNHKVAATSFQRVAQLATAEGGDAAQWYERAYQEDSSDQSIALAYGKTLLTQGQVGAAIFILEPQLNSGQVTAECGRRMPRRWWRRGDMPRRSRWRGAV